MTTKKVGTHLFIDTNVLLNFYAYSKDDLKELEKLVKLLKTKTIKLYLTQQVVDEFYRNREAKLAESFDSFRPLGSAGCPSFMVALPEYKAFKSALNAAKKSRNALIDKARTEAESRELLADQLFARIVKRAGVIAITNEAYAAADKRSRLGNPPGKPQGKSASIGDELNWELLLANVPNESDLHIVTKDSDYASKLDPTLAKGFLVDEWTQTKSGDLYLHEQIGQFFKANYPDEEFSLEIEKREAIDALVGSPNFASTHAAVSLLTPYVAFLTDEEAEEVLQGALSNSQVAWIASDSDVEAFLTKMLKQHGEDISTKLLNRLNDALGLDSEETEEETEDEEEEEEELI